MIRRLAKILGSLPQGEKIGIAFSGIRLATPYLFAAIGETFAQRSGVLNLGVDGIMLMGAFSAFYVAWSTENLWLGLLAGAIGAGESGTGLQVIAARGALDVQAQMDEIKVQSRDELQILSANAQVEWAAAKRISLSTAGGANITIDGGNILVQCPGKLIVHAGKKNLDGPAQVSYPLPALPTTICVDCLMKARDAGSPFVTR